MEVTGLINTMIPAIKELTGLEQLCLILPENLSEFFINYSTMLNNGYALFSNIEGIDSYINKDAGHMILLSLYSNQDRHGILKSSLLQLSNDCGVSRVHIRRYLDEAITSGMIKKEGKDGPYIITSDLNDIIKKYMATYFVCVMHGINLL